MKKFILMIFAVSVFFTGLGGIAKQIEAWLDSEEIAFISVQRPDNIERKIKLSESFNVVREGNKPLIIKAERKDFRFDHLQINPPAQMGKPFEFEHELRLAPSKQIEELPRIHGKSFIIIKRQIGEKTGNPDNSKIGVAPVRVLIERENKSE
jgi:hypothetical protein